MSRILILLNKITHTSIPFELTVRIAENSGMDITVASLYDENKKSITPIDDEKRFPINVRMLGAKSRFDYQAWFAFVEELNCGYDLVHTHHNFSGSIARILAALTNIPVINTEHRDHSSYALIQNLINAPTLPLAKKNISNSQVTQDSFRWYERLLLKRNQLTVIHNGVNTERIEAVVAEESASPTNNTLRICTVGRMIPVKNQKLLMRAFSSIVKSGCDINLVLVGDGPLRGELEALSIELGISNHVRFTGEVSRQQVYKIFGQSDIFVIPSYAEGFCVAAVEAMAAGLPVIASDIPVFHEVIGECGIFAPPESPEAFADELHDLLTDDEYRQERGSACRTRAKNNFDLDKTAEEYCNLYREIISETK